jgi:hypothetical protein
VRFHRVCKARRVPVAAAVLGALLLGALTTAGPARSADVHVVLSVHPGPLTLGTADDLFSRAHASTRLRRIAITVTDARGSGAGWRLEAHPSGTTTGVVTVAGIEVRCGNRSTCSLPRAPAPLPATLTTGRPTVVLAARKGEGMGSIEIVLTVATSSTDTKLALAFSLRAA